MAICRSWTGTVSPMIAIATGNIPPDAMPPTMRVARRNGKSPASAPRNAAAITIARQISMMRGLPNMSAIGPRIGCTSANGSANAVESSATVAGSTRKSCAIGGIIGSTARVNSAVAKAIRLTIVSTRLIAVPGLGLSRRRLGDLVERDEDAKQPLHVRERDHVGSVGRRLVRVPMSLDEDAGDADGDRGARQHRNEFALAARRRALPARLLHRMGGIEDHRRADAREDRQRAHVGDEG